MRLLEEQDPLGHWEYDQAVICVQSALPTIRDGLCAIWQEDPDLAWDVYNDQAALLGYGPARDVFDTMWYVAEWMKCEGLTVLEE